MAVLDDLVTVEGLAGWSESLPGRLGEAAGFVEAGSAAFCASMSFNSKDNYRFAPSWSLRGRDLNETERGCAAIDSGREKGCAKQAEIEVTEGEWRLCWCGEPGTDNPHSRPVSRAGLRQAKDKGPRGLKAGTAGAQRLKNKKASHAVTDRPERLQGVGVKTIY